MKPLVVYYSRTGTTRKVAEAIADLLRCGYEQVIDARNRAGLLGYLLSGRDAMRRRLTAIKEVAKNPSLYDVVVIGTPVWVYTASTPIRTYLAQRRRLFKGVAFFCTYGGDCGHVISDMEELCRRKPRALLELQTKEVRKGEYAQKVQDFTARLAE